MDGILSVCAFSKLIELTRSKNTPETIHTTAYVQSPGCSLYVKRLVYRCTHLSFWW